MRAARGQSATGGSVEGALGEELRGMCAYTRLDREFGRRGNSQRAFTGMLATEGESLAIMLTDCLR